MDCVIFIYFFNSNLVRMRELYEGRDGVYCEEDSYNGDHHVLGHTISLMNCFMSVVAYLVLIA
jgi:hypothetical protein